MFVCLRTSPEKNTDYNRSRDPKVIGDKFRKIFCRALLYYINTRPNILLIKNLSKTLHIDYSQSSVNWLIVKNVVVLFPNLPVAPQITRGCLVTSAIWFCLDNLARTPFSWGVTGIAQHQRVDWFRTDLLKFLSWHSWSMNSPCFSSKICDLGAAWEILSSINFGHR